VPTKVYSIFKELFQNKPSLKNMQHFLDNQNIFPLNMNFVTKDGDIGYHMTGLFPKRKYNVGQGVYPKKGWLKENLWEGMVPPSEHPRIYNPERGFIVSANNLITTENCKNGISHAFSFTHRFVRLNQMFEERIKKNGKLSIQDMKDAQLDTIDLQAQLSTKYIIKNVEKGLDSALDVLYQKNEGKKT
jgi:penicillin G amidase